VYGEIIPQPSCMRRVCAAIMARIAVEDRASKPCFLHHGYASAIQNVWKPASSHACAIAAVSCTGSMLNCRTPTLNGIAIPSHELLAAHLTPDLSTNVPGL